MVKNYIIGSLMVASASAFAFGVFGPAGTPSGQIRQRVPISGGIPAPSPLANLIELLMPNPDGTNASGVAEDTSGNDFDGTIVGGSWLAATNDRKVVFFSTNAGLDYISTTNPSTLEFYAMFAREVDAGQEDRRPYILYTNSNTDFITTNATEIRWGDGSSGDDVEVGQCYAWTNEPTRGELTNVWYLSATNFGLPPWFEQNRDYTVNIFGLVTFPGNYGSLLPSFVTTNDPTATGMRGIPSNMSIDDGVASFNGSSASVQVQDSDTPGNDWEFDETVAVTLFTRIRLNSVATYDRVFVKRKKLAPGNGWEFLVSATTNIGFIMNSPGLVWVETLPNSLSLNTWHDICLTKAAGTNALAFDIYIDGVVMTLITNNNTSISGFSPAAENLFLGAQVGGGSYMDGYMKWAGGGLSVFPSNVIYDMSLIPDPTFP